MENSPDFIEAIDLMERFARIRPRLATPESIASLRDALNKPHRQACLFLLLIVDVSVVAQLMPDLFEALLRQRDTELVRGIIGRLPKAERRELVSNEVSRRINTADDDELRRIAELLDHLDQRDALSKLVAFALDHEDPRINEVGEDFGRET